jgi:hypothetical protein
MAATFTDTKPFIVDEWVSHYEGEYRHKVQVVAVDGDTVTIEDHGRQEKFSPRASDGMFVKLGSPDFEVMPTMIYHREEPVEKMSRRSFFGFFK